jgi:hypothetical protein
MTNAARDLYQAGSAHVETGAVLVQVLVGLRLA